MVGIEVVTGDCSFVVPWWMSGLIMCGGQKSMRETQAHYDLRDMFNLMEERVGGHAPVHYI